MLLWITFFFSKYFDNFLTFFTAEKTFFQNNRQCFNKQNALQLFYCRADFYFISFVFSLNRRITVCKTRKATARTRRAEIIK